MLENREAYPIKLLKEATAVTAYEGIKEMGFGSPIGGAIYEFFCPASGRLDFINREYGHWTKSPRSLLSDTALPWDMITNSAIAITTILGTTYEIATTTILGVTPEEVIIRTPLVAMGAVLGARLALNALTHATIDLTDKFIAK